MSRSDDGRPRPPPGARQLPYRKPTEGRDYWVIDDALPDPQAVRERSLAREDWIHGFPHRPEAWPGHRALGGLSPEELSVVETHVREATGAQRLWVQGTDDGTALNHNCIQVVGRGEGEVRPHTDSRRLCRYAGVLYLSPDAPAACGTSFFRQRLPTGALGGNTVPPPHATLVDALGTRHVPAGSFSEDVRVGHKYNRLLVYAANIIHSASAYYGEHFEEMRMAAVFFWMA
jgi:hypothetical protein